jgi:hypothetical protein
MRKLDLLLVVSIMRPSTSVLSSAWLEWIIRVIAFLVVISWAFRSHIGPH